MKELQQFEPHIFIWMWYCLDVIRNRFEREEKKILEKNCSFIATNIQVECQQNLKIYLDEMTHFHRNDNKRNDDSIEGIYGESMNKNWTIFFTSSQSFWISIEREKKKGDAIRKS